VEKIDLIFKHVKVPATNLSGIKKQWITIMDSLLKPAWIQEIKRWFINLYLPVLASIPAIVAMFILFAYLPSLFHFSSNLLPKDRYSPGIKADSLSVDHEMRRYTAEFDHLQKELSRSVPRSAYLVINTTENTFRLYKGPAMIRQGICSTGSLTMLTDGKEKKWYFETPRGLFTIREKKINPVWKKPDWAFVEEGLPIPSANHPSRIEYGTLGDYALSLGDGYLIHGTLYQRFLGMPVTHGCVRLGDDDLEAVFKMLPVGAKVFIY
jgi:L,D-transpeptidase YbiS